MLLYPTFRYFPVKKLDNYNSRVENKKKRSFLGI